MYEMKFGRLVFPMWNHSFCAGQCASWILKGLNRGRMVDTQKDHLFDGRDSLMRAIHAGGRIAKREDRFASVKTQTDAQSR